MQKPVRPQPFVLAATDHGPMILNHLDYRVDGERIFGVGYELLRDGRFSMYEAGIAPALLDWRREKPGSFGSLELKPRQNGEFIGQEVSYDP
jgi:hypothetical protein